MMYLRLLVAFVLISPCACLAQGEFYLENDWARKIIESYDGTYLISGHIEEQGLGGFLTKVQPNGEVLWEIKLDDTPGQGQINPTQLLSDSLGNIYIAGQTYHYDGYGSIFIIKFNSCGELDWLRIGDYPGYWDTVHALQFAENGDILLACDQTYGVIDQGTEEGFPVGKIRMTRMNSNGDTIWYNKFYPNGCGSCLHERLISTKDNGALISVQDYIPFEGPLDNYIRSIITKFNEDGEVEWTDIFGLEEEIYGYATSIVELKSGNIVAVFYKMSSSSSNDYQPYYYKLNKNGELLDHFLLDFDTSLYYLAYALDLPNDSIIVMSLSPKEPSSSEYHFILASIDTSGNILETYVDSANYTLQKYLSITDNNDVLVALIEKMGSDTDIKVKRINPQTMALVDFPPSISDYDYLCPYPVDSYNFNLKTSSLSIEKGVAVQSWPNPATEGFYIRWRGTNLKGELNFSLYDLNGLQIESKTFKADSPEQWINTSHITTGVYVWHLEYQGEIITKKKIVISK